VFHAVYVGQLHQRIDLGPLTDLTAQYAALRNDIEAAEQTGLNPQQFDQALAAYLVPARQASALGYAVAFLAVTIIAVVGLVVVACLVRRPPVATAAAQPDDGPRGPNT
jgi:hypothetical protein